MSGFSNDIRELIESDSEKAALAIEMYCYRAAKEAGALAVAAGSVDFILFSGGIGENSSLIRNKILDYISPIIKENCIIEIIPADEERIIAESTKEFLGY